HGRDDHEIVGFIVEVVVFLAKVDRGRFGLGSRIVFHLETHHHKHTRLPPITKITAHHPSPGAKANDDTHTRGHAAEENVRAPNTGRAYGNSRLTPLQRTTRRIPEQGARCARTAREEQQTIAVQTARHLPRQRV
ncbi:unnamed protein product, partial [Ixodes persulcatus]